MRTRAIIAASIIAAFTVSSAAAGGRGGHSMTCDPNLYPGRTINNFLTGGFGATCNGVASDSAALAAWRTVAVALGSTPQVLIIPPGSRCVFDGTNNLLWDGTLGHAGVQNLIVCGYGASATNLGITTEGFPQNTNGSARIQTVSAGASSVTLINAGDAAKFSVGNWVAITGIQLQNGGFPQNFQFYEFQLITNISGSVITFTSPLANTYKSTWPVYAPGGPSSIDYGGPATIYLMGPSWNTNSQVYGLTFAPITGGAEVPIAGRTIALYDMVFVQSVPSSSAAGPAPTTSQNIWFFNSTLSTLTGSAGMEVDKSISFFGISNLSGHLFFQSATPATLLAAGVNGLVSGTPINATFRNSKFPPATQGTSIAIGPNCNGHGDTLAFDGATIPSGSSVNCSILKSVVSYNGSGTFFIPNSSVLANTINWGVPGKKYFFGFAFGGVTCNTGVSFTITDITQDGTNTNYVTDLVGALPSPTCDAGSGQQTYDRYVAYPATTITQKFSGPADLTQFAAPP